MRLLLLLSICGMALAGSLLRGTPPLLGADRDEHGCLPSAGYRWDDDIHRCVREWVGGILPNEPEPLLCGCICPRDTCEYQYPCPTETQWKKDKKRCGI